MGLLRQSIKSLLTCCVPRELLLTRGAAIGANGVPRLALTFDDGPDPEYTPVVLDLLQNAGLRATFFVVGKQAEAYPGLIRRMHDEGHEVGNHTWSHSPPAETPSDIFLEEVRRTDELIVQLTGETPRSMRPPKGELNVRKLLGLWRLRKTVALWNVDPRDYLMAESDEIVTWCSGYRPQDGDVLLFHDNHPYAIDALKMLQSRGDIERSQAVTVSDLIRPAARNKRDITPIA